MITSTFCNSKRHNQLVAPSFHSNTLANSQIKQKNIYIYMNRGIDLGEAPSQL